MTLPLDLRFTDPASPLFIDVEGDNSICLFVISTSQVATNTGESSQAQSNLGQGLEPRKRSREDDGENDHGGNFNGGEGASTRESVPRSRPTEKDRIKKPSKAAKRANPAPVAYAQAHASTSSRPGTVRGSMPPPASIPFRPLSQRPIFSQPNGHNNRRDPLFLPGSQLSVADEEAIRDSGLGIENMDADELAALLEGDGEEVGFDFGSQMGILQSGSGEFDDGPNQAEDDAMEEEGRGGGDSFDIIEDMELEATHPNGGTKVFIFAQQTRHLLTFGHPQTFKPLFED